MKVTEIQCIGFVNKLKYFVMQHETDMLDIDILDIHRERERGRGRFGCYLWETQSYRSV